MWHVHHLWSLQYCKNLHPLEGERLWICPGEGEDDGRDLRQRANQVRLFNGAVALNIHHRNPQPVHSGGGLSDTFLLLPVLPPDLHHHVPSCPHVSCTIRCLICTVCTSDF